MTHSEYEAKEDEEYDSIFSHTSHTQKESDNHLKYLDSGSKGVTQTYSKKNFEEEVDQVGAMANRSVKLDTRLRRRSPRKIRRNSSERDTHPENENFRHYSMY